VNLKYIVSEETNYNMPNNYLFEFNTSEIEKQIKNDLYELLQRIWAIGLMESCFLYLG
jgi:hypothetical protein